jgi:hypothetical protein
VTELKSANGYVIAEMLGLEAFFDIDGHDGTVFFLEDGRVMKLTNQVEAAVSQAIKNLQASDGLFKEFPIIHDVRRFSSEAELNGVTVSLTRYAVIKDNVEDYLVSDDSLDDWKEALRHFNFGNSFESPRHIQRAKDVWGTRGQEINRLSEGLARLEEQLGIKIFDIKADNIGQTSTGHICIKDLSQAEVPNYLLEMVKTVIPVEAPERKKKQRMTM